MTVVYFFYGLAFFAFGVAVLAKGQPAVADRVFHGIKLLAIFGLIHSITEWCGMAASAADSSFSNAFLVRAAAISGAASYAFMLYGGICLAGRSHRLANLVASLALGIWSLVYLAFEAGMASHGATDAASRYFIGLPGAMVTAYAFHTTVRQRSVELVRRHYSPDLASSLWDAESLQPLFTATAAVFFLYGLLTAVVQPGDLFPVNIVNTGTFLDLFGFEVQVARMLTAAAMTACFLMFLSYFNTLERLTLEEEVVRRTRDATEALDKAKQASRAKSEFLATMSHEFRTPLNAILGFSDMISHQMLGPVGERKYTEYADDIHASGEHLLEMVNDLLDISAIEAGKQVLHIEKLAIGEIIAECVSAVGQAAQEKRILLQTEIAEAPLPLHADRRAVRQILLNLLTNAVKFTPEGGRITVTAKASKRKTIFKIADTGPGIPAERLASVTEPFTKGAVNPHKTVEGWGLGLAITKSLVDLHNGRLDISSKVGKGTKVTVTLPNAEV